MSGNAEPRYWIKGPGSKQLGRSFSKAPDAIIVLLLLFGLRLELDKCVGVRLKREKENSGSCGVMGSFQRACLDPNPRSLFFIKNNETKDRHRRIMIALARACASDTEVTQTQAKHYISVSVVLNRDRDLWNEWERKVYFIFLYYALNRQWPGDSAYESLLI